MGPSRASVGRAGRALPRRELLADRRRLRRAEEAVFAVNREPPRRWAWLAGLAFVLVMVPACALPLQLTSGGAPIVGLNPRATATATPFLPQPPTGTPLPSPTAIPTATATATSVHPWGAFPGPTRMSAVEIPRQVERIPFADDVVNVVIMGSDERPDRPGHRTDVLMIVSMNPGARTVTLLSIPRDLYVYIPGWKMDRVNVADAFGGPEMVANTILYNFGIPIHHWVRLNFSGFTRIVDTLGGIDVQITGYISDECGGRIYTYQPGTVRPMDGFTALCYVRMRRTSGDIDRLRRQQEVLLAIFRKAISLNGLARVPELYGTLARMLQTDIGLEQALPLIPLASHVAADPAAIRQYRMDLTMSSMGREPELNSSVLFPDREAIQAMLRAAFGP